VRPHGTRARYVTDRCRCEACRRANREYQRRLTRVQLEERWGARTPRFVDAGLIAPIELPLGISRNLYRRSDVLSLVGERVPRGG